MNAKQIAALPNCVALVEWRDRRGGGHSVASIGRDSEGRVWIAPANWLAGSLLFHGLIARSARSVTPIISENEIREWSEKQ